MLALDCADLDDALATAERMSPWFGVFKVGYELYAGAGPDALDALRHKGFRVFADLKLHDIPTTVARAARVLGRHGVDFLNFHAAGGDVMGVDWRINIDQAWMDISYRSAIQGNLDPAVLFAPLPELRVRVHELLKRTGSRPGHIFNLGHGVMPEMNPDHVKALVRMVHEMGAAR